MKNKIQKLVLIVLILVGSLSQIHCGPCAYDFEGKCSESDGSGGYYGSYEKEKLDPSTLSTEPKNEQVATGLCQGNRAKYLQLSDASLYEVSFYHSETDHSNLGNCLIFDAINENYACSAYVKVSTSTWLNKGWPLNPYSRDSTGCVSHDQYDGYTSAMVGDSLALNAVEQIRDALRNDQDVCGLCDPTRAITPEIILDNQNEEENR